MGKVKKITENGTDIYPITSTKAVYNEDGERLDIILSRTGGQGREKFDGLLGNSAILLSPHNMLKSVTFTEYKTINENGEEVSSDDHSCSDYIKAIVREIGYTYIKVSGFRATGGVAFYDRDKNFISMYSTDERYMVIPHYIKVPEDTYFIKCAVLTTKLNDHTAYLILDLDMSSAKIIYPWLYISHEKDLICEGVSNGYMKTDGTIEESSTGKIYKYVFSSDSTLCVYVTNTTQLPKNSGLCTVWIVNSGSTALQKYTLDDTGNSLENFTIPITKGSQVWVQSDGTSTPVVKALVTVSLNEYLNNLSFANSIKQIDSISISEWSSPGTTTTDMELYTLRKAFEKLCTLLVESNILKSFRIITASDV